MKISCFSLNNISAKRSQSLQNQKIHLNNSTEDNFSFSGKVNNVDKFLNKTKDESLKTVILEISSIDGMNKILNKMSEDGLKTLTETVRPHKELFMSAFRGNILTNFGENFRLDKLLDIKKIQTEKELLKAVSKAKVYFDRYKNYAKDGTKHFIYKLENISGEKYLREQIDFHDFSGDSFEIEGLDLTLTREEPIIKTNLIKKEIKSLPDIIQQDILNSPDNFLIIGHRDLLSHQTFWTENL